jgi:hypothetical protein
MLMHIFSEDTEQFPGPSAIQAACVQFEHPADKGDDDDDEEEDSAAARKSSADTARYEAILDQAEWSFFFKPGSLKYLSSSLFDIFDACFQKHFLSNKRLEASFLARTDNEDEENTSEHEKTFTRYAADILHDVKQHMTTRTSKDHRESIYARLYFFFYSWGHLHANIPFMCSSMATAVNKRLIECQHGLCDVSCFLYIIIGWHGMHGMHGGGSDPANLVGSHHGGSLLLLCDSATLLGSQSHREQSSSSSSISSLRHAIQCILLDRQDLLTVIYY